jgi:hypothetical protein
MGAGGGEDTGESVAIGDFGLRIADLFENAKNWKKFIFIGNGFIFIFFLTGFTGWTGFFHGFQKKP